VQKVISHIFLARNKSSNPGKRSTTYTHVKINPIRQIKMLCCTRTSVTKDTKPMTIIDHQWYLVTFGYLMNFRKASEIPVYAVNAFHNNQSPVVLVAIELQ